MDGLSEYDIRRPLTLTGTNLLGFVKHNAISDSRYFGEVFGRPFAEPLPRWDDEAKRGTDHWASSERPGLWSSTVRAEDRRAWSVRKPCAGLHFFTLFWGW
jgi:hypothetical protein